MNVYLLLGLLFAAIPFLYWSFFNSDNIDHEQAAEDDQREIEELEKELPHETTN